MTYPNELKYTKDHEWVKLEDDVAIVGITDYALEQLGDVVHIELPSVDEQFDAGSTFGTIESTKTVSDLYMPVTGKIKSVNNDLEDNLETLSDKPYTDGWLIKVAVTEAGDELISAAEYEKFISEDE
ncbi:glycine cleavage system protein GcvH [Pseudobacteriovorax antillogorgiicola]|uniref:Glycine cleavage system H protein n=1 Tax=Pseudobacteriovorax antillogorgiicola TaxID=1513793 RepID=A0A1Y6B5V5_9BACT|nr:glycine cleavage system protein GcvH [Pseudobacteriovorax antillogorgiicola]TCS59124.1 glycine cleavage system H protein [Pseudobacteriovorax antillogorgiicola]SME91522.1 glycine cleavage system H protein [Pseudobacteriovorax antillogorgiicola]